MASGKANKMISAKMEKALNEQINAEAFSAYLYMSMSAYFKSCNLPGFAHWMDIQAQEEYIPQESSMIISSRGAAR